MIDFITEHLLRPGKLTLIIVTRYLKLCPLAPVNTEIELVKLFEKRMYDFGRKELMLEYTDLKVYGFRISRMQMEV